MATGDEGLDCDPALDDHHWRAEWRLLHMLPVPLNLPLNQALFRIPSMPSRRSLASLAYNKLGISGLRLCPRSSKVAVLMSSKLRTMQTI